MEFVELYACFNPKTRLYKALRQGSIFGEPLGQLTKFYKHIDKAKEYGCKKFGFSKVVKVKIEVIKDE